MRRALITGVTGQDGTYLAEHLLGLGYQVWGLVHGQENAKAPALQALLPDLRLVGGDLLDSGSLTAAVAAAEPDEVYNLAAVTLVPFSFAQPELTSEVTGLGVLRMLEAVRRAGHPDTRFYQASTSEMFGQVTVSPQNETTPFHPRSPYGVAKVFGHHITVNYRESYGLHAAVGILFNHTSPRHGAAFLPRKVARGAARIALGLDRTLPLGNLDARRDWGFAGDYVRAIHLILQASQPRDYVIGSGEPRSVRDLVEAAFAAVDLDWEEYVQVDPALVRPAEVDALCADASRARADLGWVPTVGFKELVWLMVQAELDREQGRGQ